MHKPPQWHKNHPQWHTKYLQTSTNSLKNFHKYTKTSTMTHKTSTKRLKIFTMTQPLQTSTNSHKPPKIHKKTSTKSPQNLHKETWNYHCSSFSSRRWRMVERTNHQDEEDEPNSRDRLCTCTLQGGSNMADMSAESWWSLLVSPEREQPGAESVGRGTGCWGRAGRRFPELNPDFQ